MLEIVFPRFEISKFSGGACPRTPLEKLRLRREPPNLQQSDFGLDPPLANTRVALQSSARPQSARILSPLPDIRPDIRPVEKD